VYGCGPTEAELFRRLGPPLGVAPTLTSHPVSAAGAIAVPRNRCASVAHTSPVTALELEALARCGVEHLCTRSIGVDHIDLEAAARLGITVDNVVYAPDSVADFTLLLILRLVRPATTVGAEDEALLGRDLGELTVGVVGPGRIGRAVIRRLEAFGATVLASTRSGAERAVPGLPGVPCVPLADLLAHSDVVTLHTPLDARTRHLIGPDQLATIKPGALLVNTGRGGLVDTDALVAALERGALGGAALDVLDDEARLAPRLRALPNVVLTPHAAYRTRRTLREVVERTLLNCLDVERTRAHGPVDGGDCLRRLLGRA
jgi:D-specific alpha-keto acid dehydrogenase